MYRDDTSRVTRRESLGSVEMESSLLRKCVVSLMYDGSLETSGFRMLLTYSEMCSVGWPLAETMGLPGGLLRSLWILGRM